MVISCSWATEEISPSKIIKQEIEDLRSPVASPVKEKKIFSYQTKKAFPIPEYLKQKISLSINETLPLKYALKSLAEYTKIDLQLDPSIQQSIVFSARHRPLIDIIQDICELAGLRYRLIKGGIRIEQDTPYPVNYNAHFLNMMRSSNAQISIATDVFSNTKDSSVKLDNGSNSSVSAKSENNFWEEVAANLETILSNEEESSFTIHRHGGIIAVRATSRQHALIEQYFQTLKRAISTQVLIEAKVIEVNLKDEFKAGINWQKLGKSILKMDAPFGTIAQQSAQLDPSQANQPILSFGVKGNDFSAIVKAIEQFGSCKTLSSPRLTVLNNQQAILKVAENQVYFRLKYDKEYNLNVERESVNVSSDIHTVPIGFVMAVQPSIDYETGEILLALRPTISRLSSSVSDPAVDIALANSKDHSAQYTPSLVPQTKVQEIDSVLRVPLGGGMVTLGGLMETRTNVENTKLPIAGDIPVLGKLLFSAQAEVNEVVELVILLKATVVEPHEELDPADQRLLENYVKDARPF